MFSLKICIVVFISELIDKSYNKSLFLYHFVCFVKYRRKVFGSYVSKIFKDICLKIEARFDFQFLETNIDGDHVHFLIQSVPMNSPKNIISMGKSS